MSVGVKLPARALNVCFRDRLIGLGRPAWVESGRPGDRHPTRASASRTGSDRPARQYRDAAVPPPSDGAHARILRSPGSSGGRARPTALSALSSAATARWCVNRPLAAASPLAACVSADPSGGRHTEPCHLVEHVAPDFCLGPLIAQNPGVKTPADDGLVAIHRGFNQASAIIA
jgi:hypothetical protein